MRQTPPSKCVTFFQYGEKLSNPFGTSSKGFDGVGYEVIPGGGVLVFDGVGGYVKS